MGPVIGDLLHRSPLHVLAFPRDPNPYQELLHAELQRRDAGVAYVGDETPSQSVNMLLLPAMIALGRLRGARVLHVHWVYPFGLPWTRRRPFRAVPDVLLVAALRTARACGVHVVWTLHNVVPHHPVFADDLRARRRLVEACDLVIAHSAPALDELGRRVGATPKRSRVIALGPYADRRPRLPRRGTRRVAFFGKVEEYKGVEELLEAVSALPPDCPMQLTVAGACTDRALRGRLERRAAMIGPRIDLRLEWLDDDGVDALFAGIDALVLPFRDVTTTSTAAHALAHGVPVVIPDLATLGDLRAGVIRYDGTITGLAAMLRALSLFEPEQLDALGAAAYEAAHDRTWADVAQETLAAYASLTEGAA